VCCSDGTSALAAFVSGPNALQTLNISGTAANLEMLLPAVMRGTCPVFSFSICYFICILFIYLLVVASYFLY
jgi:hypothetical protein